MSKSWAYEASKNKLVNVTSLKYARCNGENGVQDDIQGASPLKPEKHDFFLGSLGCVIH